jgi:hypothetical protein
MSQDVLSVIGLYLVKGVAGNVGLPGAPLLHFMLGVNAVTGQATGHAKQTQAVAAPYNDIPITIKAGHVQSTGLGKYTKVVWLAGEGFVSFPPPAIGSYLVPFTAHFAVDDHWNGVGGWSLGAHHIENVPVKSA